MDKTIRSLARNLFLQVLPLMWRISPMLLVGALTLRLLQAAVPAAQLILTKELIDAITAMIQREGVSLNDAIVILGLQAGLVAAEYGLKSCNDYLMMVLKQKAYYEVNRSVIEKCAKLPLVYYDQPQYYDKLQRISQGVEHRGLSIFEFLFQLLQSVFTLAGYMILLANLHYSLALGMLLLVIPSFIINNNIGKQKYLQMVDQTPKSRKVDYLTDLLKGREAAKEIKTFRLFPYISGQWKKLFWENALEQRGLEKRSQWKQFLSELLTNGVTFGITAYLLYWTYLGNITLGYFVALNQALVTTRHQLVIIAVNTARIYEDLLFMSELFEFLDMDVEEERRDKQELPGRLKTGIRVEGLTFAFPNHPGDVLRNISFQAKPGQKVAIVGSNGAGKSTLVKCLMGLYRPQQGHIYIDGVEAESILHVQDYFSAVFQDFVRFQFSVQESIGFGDMKHMDNRAMAEAAAAKAGASSFIERMPGRYDTGLGSVFQDGIELSYGQWQKIALSRAFFKDAEIIILDEPTSAMDPVAEALLFEKFSQLTEGKTSFMVSHRLGSCRGADLILVLQEGSLIEQGTHEELMDLNGEYANMFRKQSKWYENTA